MKKRDKIIVISLGGSLIVPDMIDLGFLRKFKKIIEKHIQDYRFVVVCGGGSIARKYINALKKQGKNSYIQSLSGIAVTRLNARFMTYFFGKDANEDIPHNMKKIKNLLLKNEIIFCGALRYHANETSDATSAKLAKFFNTEFINLTDVGGLYDKNPKKYKSAKLVPEISWKEFKKITDNLKYSPGQHFVLDQHAAKIIKKYKIKTYILGKNLKNLDNLLSGEEFKGTTIKD